MPSFVFKKGDPIKGRAFSIPDEIITIVTYSRSSSIKTNTSTMPKASFTTKLKYKFDNFISKGTSQMILGLTLFSISFIFLCSILLLAFGLGPTHDEPLTLPQSIWISLTHMLDPGTVSGNEGNWPFMIFMMTVTLFGLIIITILIGLISNGIMVKIERLRKGRSFVIEENHVVILGWSSKVFTLLSELIIANENQSDAAIVILAEKDKVEMEDEIREKVKKFKTTRIICRTGNPIDLDDLQIVNLKESKSIILLDNDSENSDSQIIKSIVAITTQIFNRKTPFHITAEIKDKKNLAVAKMVGKDEVELILSDEIISRIMVQTSRQSGLSVVYIELLDFDGDEIYFSKAPTLTGKIYRDILFAYPNSSIMGIHQATTQSVLINPPMDLVFQEGDQVIGITEDDDTLIPAAQPSTEFNPDHVALRDKDVPHPEKILIIGMNPRGKHIIKEIDQYVASKSTLKVISKFENSSDEVMGLGTEMSNLTVSFEALDTTDGPTLQNQGLGDFDYIILLSYKNYFPLQEADAQTLITLLHLRYFSEHHETHFKIVSEMLDMKNRILANVTSADDFIVSDSLISLLMSQISENKFLMRVFEELFDASGDEIYIREMNQYVTLHEPVNFYTVLESACRKNETAIGYRLMNEAKSIEKNYGVVVNPVKNELVTFNEQDMIIVLSAH